MRQVKISVGGVLRGLQKTWAYPNGKSLGLFLTPYFDCFVDGTDDAGKTAREKFSVLRFGVHCTDGKTATVVGLSDQQTHAIKAWIPTYRVHSADSQENGAWQVYQNFLIHDGPDDALEIFATIGCIEIMGPKGFIRFNDLIIAMSGPKARGRDEQLLEIGRAGRMIISYAKAERPPFQKAR